MRSFQTPTLPVITLPTVTVTLTAAGNDPRSQVSLKTGENSTLSGLVWWERLEYFLCWRVTVDHTARPRRTLAYDYDHREPRHNTDNTCSVQT